MCDIESNSLSYFSSYYNVAENFLDVGVIIYLYDREWKFNYHYIVCNFILSRDYVNIQPINNLKTIIDHYVNVHILSDRSINIESIKASYVDHRNIECYFTKFTNMIDVARINLIYTSNRIYSSPINYINCSNKSFTKDAYVSIRIHEKHKLDAVMAYKFYIQKNNKFYTHLMSILEDLSLVLSGIFIVHENRNYVCLPDSIDYFNKCDKVSFINIHVWTNRK